MPVVDFFFFWTGFYMQRGFKEKMVLDKNKVLFYK